MRWYVALIPPPIGLSCVAVALATAKPLCGVACRGTTQRIAIVSSISLEQYVQRFQVVRESTENLVFFELVGHRNLNGSVEGSSPKWTRFRTL